MIIDRKISGLLAVTALAAWTSAAQATLIGDTIDIDATHTFSGSCNGVYSASGVTVGPGPEMTVANKVSGSCNGGVDVDVGDSSFTLTGFHEPAGYADFTDGVISLTDLDWVGTPGTITDVVMTSPLNSLFNNPGEGFASVLPAMLIDWGDDFINITFSTPGGGSFEYRNDGVGVFQITAEHEVPEPATLALFSLGLAGFGWSRRKRS